MAVVLVLESQGMDWDRLAGALQSSGYTVLRARSGRAADAFLKYSCADIVIAEDEPAHEDLHDALNRAAAMGIPMLVISDEIVDAAQSCFLSKPCSATDLLRKVRVLTPAQITIARAADHWSFRCQRDA